jgi:4-aminobutyrate aminotransferase/(S)-3-amino-2-methylpropionate transaminase
VQRESSNLEYLARLGRVEVPNATYFPKDRPLVFQKAMGSKIFDVEQNEYIDLCAGFGVLALGHNPSEHVEHFKNISNEIVHGMGDVYPSTSKIKFIETLLTALQKEAPHFGKVGLAVTGAQAVEFALKTAFLHTKKFGVLSCKGGYHGVDLGVLAATSRQDFREPFAPWIAQDHVQMIEPECSRKDVLQAIAQLKDQGGLAAILIEPILGRGGTIPLDLKWLRMLSDVAHAEGAFFILDEVLVGMGRTGRLTFAGELQADLSCFGKAIGGGMPVSACVGRRAVLDAWPADLPEAIHTGTFFGHPLSCDIGTITINKIIGDDLALRAAELGQKCMRFLQEKLSKNPRVTTIRGQGLMLCIELHQDGAGAELMDKLRQQKIIALVAGQNGRCLSITPALNIPEDLLMNSLAKICDLI